MATNHLPNANFGISASDAGDAAIIELDQTTMIVPRATPFTDDGRQFSSSRPWTGNAMPPSWWDPTTNDATAPDVLLKLDYVCGYRTTQTRNNLFWIDEPTTIMYHAAAVVVVCNVVTRTQRHFTGHEDDVVCLSYCPRKRIAASGGLGKRNTAPIIVWNVDDMKCVRVISGFLQFAVVAVAISEDGTRVFGTGMDQYHTVAIFDVATGAVLASANGDSNRIIFLAVDRTMGKSSKKNFVTVGVSHVKFWEKTKEKITGSKATGMDLSTQTMVSIAFTSSYTLVGNVSGAIYVFDNGVPVRSIQAHSDQVCTLFAVGTTLFSGGRDGLVKQWELGVDLSNKKTPLAKPIEYDINQFSVLSANQLSGKPRRTNGVRSIYVTNGNILVGTHLASILYFTNPEDCTVLLEAHFNDTKGDDAELWGLDVHPTEPFFCSSSEDGTLRLWSFELGSMVLMADVKYPSRVCAFSMDGSMIAVGHQNGAFSVWDATTLTPVVPHTRKRKSRIQAMAWSPNGKYLAMSMGQENLVDIFYVKRDFQYIGSCDGFSSNIKKIDFNLSSSLIRCCTNAYEVIHFNIPGCEVNQHTDICEERWARHSCYISWGAQGIWEGCNDGTDINCTAKSRSEKYLAAGYDSNEVKLFRFPCLSKGFDVMNRYIYPDCRSYRNHSSHVTNLGWSADDRYLVSSGGSDNTILRWRVLQVPKPKAEEKFVPTDDEGMEELRRKLNTTVGDREESMSGEDLDHSDEHSHSFTRSTMHKTQRATTLRKPGEGLEGVQSRFLRSTAAMEEHRRLAPDQRRKIIEHQEKLARFSRPPTQ